MEKRILVIDFEANDLGALERALRSEAMAPSSARDGQEVLDRWAEVTPDAVLLAVDARAHRHREVIRIVRQLAGGSAPILLFGRAEPDDPIRAPSEAIAQGGDYFFRLPCDVGYLAGRVRAWAERGVRAPTAPAPSARSPEAPLLEGLAWTVAHEGGPHPILDRLRAPEEAPSAEPLDPWAWSEELEFSEVPLDDLDPVPEPPPEAIVEPPPPHEDPSRGPSDPVGASRLDRSSQRAGRPEDRRDDRGADRRDDRGADRREDRGADPRSEGPDDAMARGGAGVGEAERDALLLDEVDADPLPELRIDEVEAPIGLRRAVDLAEELPELVILEPTPNVPLARIELDPKPLPEDDETIFFALEEAPPAGLAGIDREALAEIAASEVAAISELSDAGEVPPALAERPTGDPGLGPRAWGPVGDHPSRAPAPSAPAANEADPPEAPGAARGDAPRGPGPVEVAFPTVEAELERVVSGRPKAQGPRIPAETLAALQALLAGHPPAPAARDRAEGTETPRGGPGPGSDEPPRADESANAVTRDDGCADLPVERGVDVSEDSAPRGI